MRRGLLLGGRSHRRQWVFFGRRGGERRQLAANKARAPDARVPKKTPRVLGDTSFTRSEGLCTSILAQRSSGATRGRSGGRRLIAVGQTGATRRNRHRGDVITDGAQLATHRRSRKGGSSVRRRKGRWSRPPSLRGNESRGRSARTSLQLQKSVGERLASNTLARRAPKRATARVNGGLARSHRRR